jgi:hypothetical protein
VCSSDLVEYIQQTATKLIENKAYKEIPSVSSLYGAGNASKNIIEDTSILIQTWSNKIYNKMAGWTLISPF